MREWSSPIKAGSDFIFILSPCHLRSLNPEEFKNPIMQLPLISLIALATLLGGITASPIDSKDIRRTTML